MKISYYIVPLALISGILSGCASMTPAINEASNITLVPDPAPIIPEESTSVASKENLPNVELTDEILFKVVSAEIAFQRADFPAAFATMMAVAQQTRDPRLPKRAMEMALIAKQPLQAFIASRLWHEYSPDSDEATQYYLGFMVINNNLAEVNTIISQRLAGATPKERGLIILQTQRLVMRGTDKEASFKLLEELCKPYPDLLETHLALAQAAYASNNSVRALVEAHAAIMLSPNSQIAALTLAQVSASPDAALKALADFLIQNPTAHEVRRAYAGMLIEQKQFAQARSQFDILQAERPQDPAIMYTQGVLALQMNDVVSAEKNLKDFVNELEASSSEQRDPTSAYLYLSQIADDRNDGVAALDWLSKVQSYNGKNAAYFNAQLRTALLMAKYGQLDQARQFLHELKASPEEQIEIIQLDAELLRNAKRDADAMSLLQEATKSHPDNPDLLYDFAMMAEKFDRIDEMEKALRQVIKINPENQHAYNALGYSFADRNIRLPEARALIEKALSLAPDDAFIIDSMGWLEFRENQNEKALAFLQRAYQIRPDVEIAVHVGEVLWSMGDQQKAKSIWKEAQQKDPSNAALKSTLERLKVSL
ncbi:tetratricopeptide repeat protein [Solimicrobium silvestre]|uniref:Tetratricopeptide repeat n=1 Tax=Solimicrobium silvestre TaxID=2099400 RepID=A0A2S9H1B0_9BURK|nr:tetratricopeptide repeat protein [Solimicrobium silvestre]PRC93771.1 Tetratricopeptide repeat [Solimicrobium silvestre]